MVQVWGGAKKRAAPAFWGGGITTDVTSIGYARLARSLVRFCGMRCAEAAALVGGCAGVPMGIFTRNGAAPYLTEVQLYKSLEALLAQMGGEQAVKTEAGSHLRALLNDLAERFWRAYGMEITDSRTVYALCESSLLPGVEPTICLLE